MTHKLMLLAALVVAGLLDISAARSMKLNIGDDMDDDDVDQRYVLGGLTCCEKDPKIKIPISIDTNDGYFKGISSIKNTSDWVYKIKYKSASASQNFTLTNLGVVFYNAEVIYHDVPSVGKFELDMRSSNFTVTMVATKNPHEDCQITFYVDASIDISLARDEGSVLFLLLIKMPQVKDALLRNAKEDFKLFLSTTLSFDFEDLVETKDKGKLCKKVPSGNPRHFSTL